MKMNRATLCLGLVAASLSGLVFGYAWLNESPTWWWMGSLTLLSAVLFTLSGLHVLGRSSILKAGGPGSAPLLGDLLVQKYHLITEEQLGRALAEQRKAKHRLGMILVEMGALTLQQLAEVLEEQISHQSRPTAIAQPDMRVEQA
jgi:hypothetical protein